MLEAARCHYMPIQLAANLSGVTGYLASQEIWHWHRV